ncbi:MAG: hypothetical protein SGPRY_001629 [Prymnesium sp.]
MADCSSSQEDAVSLPEILEKCERFGLMLAGAAGPQLSDWSKTHLAHALGWADYIQRVMELVDPQSPDAETFDLAIRVLQDRYATEDPNGSIFVSRDRLDMSLRSLLRSRFELLRILLGNRSASQELYKATLLLALSGTAHSAGKDLETVCDALMPSIRTNAMLQLLQTMAARCAAVDVTTNQQEPGALDSRVLMAPALARLVGNRAARVLDGMRGEGCFSDWLRALFEQPVFRKIPHLSIKLHSGPVAQQLCCNEQRSRLSRQPLYAHRPKAHTMQLLSVRHPKRLRRCDSFQLD